MERGKTLEMQIAVDANGIVEFTGVDMGGQSELVSRAGDFLAVKIAGGMHWSARGQQSYHKASIKVLERLTEPELRNHRIWLHVRDTGLDIPLRGRGDGIKYFLNKYFQPEQVGSSV